jgi:hypothetical protein
MDTIFASASMSTRPWRHPSGRLMLRPLLPLACFPAPNIEGCLLRPLLVQEHWSAFQAFERLDASNQERYRYVRDAADHLLEPQDHAESFDVLNRLFDSDLCGRSNSMMMVRTTAVIAGLRTRMSTFYCVFLNQGGWGPFLSGVEGEQQQDDGARGVAPGGTVVVRMAKRAAAD